MFKTLFKPRPAEAAGQALYAAAVAQARQSAFYAELGAADTPEGRFELYTVHVVLLVRRLKGQGAQADETAQALFDAYVGGLDIALRELGTGDLSMGKKMKKLGQAFYGRLKHYDAAFASLPDQAELTALAERTLVGGDQANAAPFVDYALRAERLLAGSVTADLLAGHAAWPRVTA
ncbi:ubiquinol-cytochrome C chaperone family protein [soil metagenome]